MLLNRTEHGRAEGRGPGGAGGGCAGVGGRGGGPQSPTCLDPGSRAHKAPAPGHARGWMWPTSAIPVMTSECGSRPSLPGHSRLM